LNIPPTKVKIYFLAAEAVPFIKVGGLGDVAGSLPEAILKIREMKGSPVHFDLRMAIPYHPGIDPSYKNELPIAEFTIQKNHSEIPIKVFRAKIHNLIVYLVDAEPIYNAASVYSLNTLEDGEKYTLFSLAALKLTNVIRWQPDILHVNDWHTALSAYLNRMRNPNKIIPVSILTLHNLPFMGAGTESSLNDFEIPHGSNPDLPNWALRQPLPLGLASVDKIVAVSPNYAKEIQTSKGGCSLEKYFRKNSERITGILNGIDTQIWNPATDQFLNSNYDASSLEKKFLNKRFLKEEFGFRSDDRVPLLILISRMDFQKGVDLVVDGLSLIVDLPWNAILLGSGDSRLEKQCLKLQKAYPRKVKTIIRFDAALSHQLYAGGDILMIPSRYEPCGLAQMIAMRYGCIPVARKTGGLKDTVIPAPRRQKTGYIFSGLAPQDFAVSLKQALTDFQNKPYWSSIQNNAMTRDFSWDQSARAYASLFLDLLAERKESE
jgi:starch synthase